MSLSVTNGKNFIIKQKVAGVDTSFYPVTRFANVLNTSNESLDTVIGALRTVPAAPETNADKKFLRGDGTWAEIAAASTSGAGIVQLSDTIEDVSTKAATPKAVNTVKGSLDTFIGTTAPATYVAKTDVGADSGVAPLNSSGLIDASYLPSYVDDVIEGYIDLPDYGANNANVVECYYDETAGKIYSDAEKTSEITPTTGKVYIDKTLDDGAEPAPLNTEYRYTGSAFVEYGSFYTTAAKTTAVTAESGKIYVDLATNKSYRYSGTVYVEISKSIIIGTTTGTAYDGGLGATLASNFNTHTSNTSNPHSVTAAQVGLGNVENKSGATIVSDNVTASYIKTTLGAATSSVDGYMTSTQAAKLDNCLQTEVIYQDQSASITNGIVFEILENAPVEEPGE